MLNTKTGDYLKKKEIKKLATEVLKWCLNEFGNPLKTMEPKVKISYNKRYKDVYGFYECRKITVMPNVCITDKVFVSTILHEFMHYLQMPKKNQQSRYDKLAYSHVYEKHPYEVEAFKFEKKHISRCMTYLRKNNII